MLDHYDFDQIARDIPDDIGVPRKWIVDEDTVNATRQQRAQAQQQQLQAEQGKEVAQLAIEAERVSS